MGELADRMADRLPDVEVLGAQGAEYRNRTSSFRVGARRVAAVDATAAGDTFIGYYPPHAPGVQSLDPP